MRESIFKKVFFGKPSKISLLSWTKLLLLEVYLGEQLLEMLSNTASFNMDAPFNGKTNGWERSLIDFIPATLINRLLSKSILVLLNDKFHSHYALMKHVQAPEGEEEIVSLYKLNNENLHLLTELKLAYNTIWITLNVIVDVVVYIATNDISITLLTGAVIEFIRRFKW
ncbi:hypothetical protein [Candidatus Venteria ishoeyi]|uniref:Uncharacterized protein n=1 Tax=Candidatus Venteria ishoeyi TaxID=1899563 RepID=A0A1H6FBD9_9GAMM|nr:hypothetical protein [Candidatus Venteria ishoeyi]SEH07398.1 Uncharacterised protein [Candidatus Venteria ishoeyi]